MLSKFYVEKYNASDDYFNITDLYVSQSQFVNQGELIFSIESSKADIDVEASADGYIYFSLIKGQKVDVGDLLYIISDDIIPDWEIEFEKLTAITSDDHELLISNKARILIEKYDINPLELKKISIKEIDVWNYLNSLRVDNFESVGINYLLKNNSVTIPVIIIGGGGGAKMIIDALKYSDKYKVVGILDDKLKVGTNVMGIFVVGNLNDVQHLLKVEITNFVIAFGVLTKRNIRYDFYLSLKELGCNFPNIVHPKACVEESVLMGEGNVILAMANIGSCVTMGNLNYINNSALISHDCTLEDNVHLAPSSVLASSIRIESNVLVGMNTTLYYGISIGSNSTILNGLVLNKSISRNTTQKVNN